MLTWLLRPLEVWLRRIVCEEMQRRHGARLSDVERDVERLVRAERISRFGGN